MKGKKPPKPASGPQDVPPPTNDGGKDPKKIRPPREDNEDDDIEEIASSKEHRMDYVNRAEIIRALRLSREADWYLFMLKEKFDNAIDFTWDNYPDAPRQEDKLVVANITLNYNKKLFRCTVTNTNAKNKPVFQNLDRILNFDMTWGTKQNDYVIRRGMLGDALKRLASIPYTLLKEDLGASAAATGSEQWTHPAIFKFNNQEYKSILTVDEIERIIESPPTSTGRQVPSTGITVDHTWHIPDKVRDPEADNGLNHLTSSRIAHFCKKYLIFTTDITFVVQIDDGRDKTVINLPATLSPTQTSSLKKWINISSIFYYSLQQFTTLLSSIDEKNKITIYQLIKKRFREWTQVPKKDVTDLDISISEFLKDKSSRAEKILSLYLRLRTEGTITTPPDKLSLPYTHKQERKMALAARIEDMVLRHDLDTSKAAYEILQGVVTYKDNASGGQIVQYPYAVEIISVPYSEDAVRKRSDPDTFESNYIAGAINYSVSPGEDNTFTGHYRPYNKKTGRIYEANNIIGVFEAYGFNFNTMVRENTQDTKLPCVIAVNLISPVLSYTSEGKSNIDIDPFHKTIEDAVEKIANKIRTFGAANILTQDVINARRTAKAEQALRELKRQMQQDEKLRRQEERQQRKEEREQEEQEKQKEREEKSKFKNVYQIVEEILLERINEYHDYNDNPEIFAKRRITQDGVWYRALPALENNRIEATESVRANVKKYIKPICKKYGVKREDIGIIAGARAVMYYNGQFKAVSFFEVERLAKNGTDVAYIEKMGMVEAFKDYADEYRIALVNSQGQLTDYAKDLSDLALESSGHVFIVTDYDVPGIIIASKLGPNIPWIGINKQTIERFNIPLPSLPDPYGSSVKKYPKGEQRHVVVPYDVKVIPKDKEKLRRLVEHGENEIEDEDGNKVIVKDLRFSADKVDLDWLWTKTVPYITKKGKKGTRVEGHKIEIDAVVKDQGSEKMWNYLLGQIVKEQPKRDYTRVIDSDVYTKTPDPPVLSGSISATASVKIVYKLQSYIYDRTQEITEQPKQEIKEELEDYEGLIDDVRAKEREIRKEIEDIVDEDEIMDDIDVVVDNAMKEVRNEVSVQSILEAAADKANEAIIKGIRKLDAEKGYGIMKALGMDDEKAAAEGESEN